MLRYTCLSFVFLLGLTLTSLPQCVRMPVKSDSFRGQVFAVSAADKPIEYFPGVDIALNKGKKEVLRLKSDSNGKFESVFQLFPGVYQIYVHAPHFDRIVTELRIVRSDQKKDSLVIGLGPTGSGTDSCEGFVKTEPFESKK